MTSPVRARLATAERRLRRFVLGDDVRRADGRCRLAPEWLVLCINNLCNLRCKMCDVGLGETSTAFYANLVGRHPMDMTLDSMELIVEQACRFRPRPRIGLAFTEPLLHPSVVELCRAASRRELFVSVTTNGYRLPAVADALVDAGLDLLTVSVDGPRETHDEIRGSRRSFDRLYEGVERVQRARSGRRSPRVQLSYTITDQNLSEMVRFAREVAALGADSLCFSHLNFITAEMADRHNASYGGDLAVARSNLGTIDLDAIDLEAMWRELGRLKAEASSRRFRLTLVPDFARFEQLETFYRRPDRFVGDRRCTDPWRMMMIQTDGTVLPAHGRCYHHPMGRVTERSLPEIWNGARFTRFRQVLDDAGGSLPACARCCGVIGKELARSSGRIDRP